MFQDCGVGEVRSVGAAVEHFDHKEVKTQRLMILLMSIKTIDELLWDTGAPAHQWARVKDYAFFQ